MGIQVNIYRYAGKDLQVQPVLGGPQWHSARRAKGDVKDSYTGKSDRFKYTG